MDVSPSLDTLSLLRLRSADWLCDRGLFFSLFLLIVDSVDFERRAKVHTAQNSPAVCIHINSINKILSHPCWSHDQKVLLTFFFLFEVFTFSVLMTRSSIASYLITLTFRIIPDCNTVWCKSRIGFIFKTCSALFLFKND